MPIDDPVDRGDVPLQRRTAEGLLQHPPVQVVVLEVPQHQAVAKHRPDVRGPAQLGGQDPVGVQVHLAGGLRGEEDDVATPQAPHLEHVPVLSVLGIHHPSGIAQKGEGVPDERRPSVARNVG